MPFFTLNTLHESLMIPQITGNASRHFYNNSRNRVIGVPLSVIIKKSFQLFLTDVNNVVGKLVFDHFFINCSLKPCLYIYIKKIFYYFFFFCPSAIR